MDTLAQLDNDGIYSDEGGSLPVLYSIYRGMAIGHLRGESILREAKLEAFLQRLHEYFVPLKQPSQRD